MLWFEFSLGRSKLVYPLSCLARYSNVSRGSLLLITRPLRFILMTGGPPQHQLNLLRCKINEPIP